MDEMDGWVRGPASDQVAEGQMLGADLGAEALLFVRIDGSVRAFRNECPHQGLPLDGGFVETLKSGERNIVCPWHAWTFRAEDGKGADVPADLQVLPVREVDGACWVRLGS